MAVHITVTRRDGGVESSSLKTFDDHQMAAIWLVQDSYFQNHNVVRIVWEVLGCQHVWDFQVEAMVNDLPGFRCKLCGSSFLIEPGLIDEMFRKSQE